MANIHSKICQVKKYNLGCFYIDFEHEMSGCDSEFGKFCAYWHIWFTMVSCHQGQIFSLENLIYKKMIPHMPYLAMLEKVDISG